MSEVEIDTKLVARIGAIIDQVGGMAKAALAAGASRSSIQKWRTGNARPPLIEMAALAEAAGVSLDWIATGIKSTDDDVVLVPRYDVTHDGSLVHMPDEDQPRVPFWRTELERMNASIEDTIALVADGREMEPRIQEGAMLAVDRSRADMSVSGVYALRPRNRLILLRSEMRLDGSLILTSDSRPGEQVITPASVDALRPIGMVVLALTRVR
jgi:phage repressor protein C with HTH and peptisase S24 domain